MCIRDRLYTGEGKEDIVEKATPEAPLALIVGAGFLLEAFEKQLMGLELSLIHIYRSTKRRLLGELGTIVCVSLKRSSYRRERHSGAISTIS